MKNKGDILGKFEKEDIVKCPDNLANIVDKILLKKIRSKKAKIAVCGLGYVGLPLAHAFCKSGYTVYGLDPDQSKIKDLEKKQSYISSFPHKEVQFLMDSGNFSAYTNFNKGNEADVVIICVPTPLNEYRNPDMQYVLNATDSISQFDKKPQLIILESTTYPGTVRQLMKPILEKTKGVCGKDFFLAYSPEREDPGNALFSTNSIPRVVGGADQKALELACALYKSIVPKVVPVSSLEVAESVKLTENIFRWINIGLINELKMIFQNLDIDIWEVIDAASTKPFGFMPFYPGPGVGGHCIPVDPLYLNWKLREKGNISQFIDLAFQINEEMSAYVIEKISEGLSCYHGKGLKDSNILMVGIAYKKNVNDFRESPALVIFKKLKDKKANINYYDPFITKISLDFADKELAGNESIVLTEEEIKRHDIVVICTNHDNIDYELIGQHASVIVDTRNAFKDFQFKQVIKA